MSVRGLATSLIWTGVCACGQADRTADTGASTTDTEAVTVSEPVGSTTQSPGSVVLPPTVQAPVTAVKTASAPAVRVEPTRIATTRADSIRLAQVRAEAVRVADSVRLAEVARARAAQPAGPREPATTAVNLAAQGKTPYDASCKKCHGVAGVPPKAMQTKFPKLKPFDAAFFAKRSSDSVVAVLMKGTSEDMKSFKDKLSHDDMVAIAAYIRTFANP